MNKRIKKKKLKRKTNYQEDNQTLCNELGKFFIELASKQKTLPFGIFDEIEKRPWDFV